MKIVYFTPHLREASGINRVLNIKANYIADVLNYEVTIITYRQHSSAIFFPFSPKVRLLHFDLDDPTFRLNALSFFERRKQLRIFMKTYEKRTREFLSNKKIDVCVSMFLGAEYKFINKIQDGSAKIVEFHLNFDHSPFRLLQKKVTFSDLKAYFQIQQLRRKTAAFQKIVVLTKSDAENWRKYFKNVDVISNPITAALQTAKPALENKNAIAVGRLEYEKGFDFLIDTWKIINQKHPDWKLTIFGEGSLKSDLQQQINDHNLEASVQIHPATNKISEKYLESSIFILTSRNEGFGLVLLEALSLGIPAVAFDCNYGPSEMIEDGKNGFLVPVGEIDELASKIGILIENEYLRHDFSRHAVASSHRYNVPIIMSQWENLFKSLLSNIDGKS